MRGRGSELQLLLRPPRPSSCVLASPSFPARRAHAPLRALPSLARPGAQTVLRLRLASSRRARRECHGGFLRPVPAHGLRGRRQRGTVGASEAERGERGSAMLALERSLLRGFFSSAESQEWKQGEISATGEGWDELKPRWRLPAPRAAVSGAGEVLCLISPEGRGRPGPLPVSRCPGWCCGCCRSRCGHGLSASVLLDSSSRCFSRLPRAVKSLWRKRDVS